MRLFKRQSDLSYNESGELRPAKISKQAHHHRYKSVPKGYSTKWTILPLLAEEFQRPAKMCGNRFSQHLFSPCCENSRSSSPSEKQAESPSLLINLKKRYKFTESFEEKNKSYLQRVNYIDKPVIDKVSPRENKRVNIVKRQYKLSSILQKKYSTPHEFDNSYFAQSKPVIRRRLSQNHHYGNYQANSKVKPRYSTPLGSTKEHETTFTSIAGIGPLPDQSKMAEMRKERLKHIYKNVLHKPGIISAKKALKHYFNDLEGSAHYEQKEPKQRLSISTKMITMNERRKSYGRWYLHPSDFGHRLKVSQNGI